MLKQLRLELKQIQISIASYSRIPIGGNLIFDTDLLSKSVKYFPLVGFLIGSILALSYWFLSFIFPVNISVILIFTLNLILTGAMHLDGLADVCDAFGASREEKRILLIMKDSHIGVYGVLSLITISLLYFTTLNNISIITLPIVILAGNAFSRIFAPIFVTVKDYVTPNETSKSKAMLSKLNLKEISIAIIIGVLPLLLLPPIYLLAIILPIISFIWFMHYCTKRIGGYTGDCLGATQQFSEVLFYLSIVIIQNYINK